MVSWWTSTAPHGGVASGTEAYYSFDFGNVHFICLNSEDSGSAPGGTMLTWLEQDLVNATADWIVAFFHHPPYSHGSHDSDSSTDSGGRMVSMRENALPILETWGVDLVLTGHSHGYERTFLLNGHYDVSSTLTSAMILDGGDGRIESNGAYEQTGLPGQEGTVYVVAGSSGSVLNGPYDHPAMFASLQMLGSVVIDVSGERLDAAFLDSQGVIQDHFTLLKGTGSIQPPAPPTNLRIR